MAGKCGARRIFVKLKRYDIIRAQIPCELPCHNDGIPAKRAAGSPCALIRNNLPAAGRASINQDAVGFAVLPFILILTPLPLLFFVLFFFQLRIISFQRLYVKHGIAVGAFHLLRSAVKCNRTAAARAFIL